MEYCIKYIKKRGVSLVDPIAVGVETFINQYVKGFSLPSKHSFLLDNHITTLSIQNIDEYENFDYYIHAGCECDGTHSFIVETDLSILYKLFCAMTYDRKSFTTEEILSSNVIVYKVKDIVIDKHIDTTKGLKSLIYNLYLPVKMELK